MIELTLPIYYNGNLMGLNWYRNAHHYTLNTAKKHYKSLVASLAHECVPIKGKYIVEYQYNYKNQISDMMNVVAVMDKFVLDALQELGLVPQDNVKFYMYSHASVGAKSETGEIKITIKEIEE